MDVICYPLLTKREMAVLISKNFLLIVIHTHTEGTVIGSLELPYAINFKMGADYNIYILYMTSKQWAKLLFSSIRYKFSHNTKSQILVIHNRLTCVFCSN